MKCQIEKNENGQVRIRWHCPHCQESYGFHPHDIEVMDFLVVHHLNSKHNQRPVEILSYEADLQDAVDEYMAALVGVERPAPTTLEQRMKE